MRMWMIDPEMLCNKHLLGEHGEIHKFRHNFEKQHNMTGRLFPIVQIEPTKMQNRHDQLVIEMVKRGMNHQSPYDQPDTSYLGDIRHSKVNIQYNKEDLINRCTKCAERIRGKLK